MFHFSFQFEVLLLELQIVELIKLDIISGKIKKGDKLLSVREYALLYKVNPNTMQKALAELESMKLIYTERTNGKYVTKDNKLIEKLKDEYAITLAKSYFQGMKRIGLGKAESIKYFSNLYFFKKISMYPSRQLLTINNLYLLASFSKYSSFGIYVYPISTWSK